MTSLAWGAVTHTGRVRQVNQDQLLAKDKMFVVADGMGGHLGGEVASAIAVEEMAKATLPNSPQELVELIQTANEAILAQSNKPELYGMGTTLVALVAPEPTDQPLLLVGNIGDSRLYLHNNEGLRQLTQDHSLVDEMVRDGLISAGEAKVHPQRNVLTRALGVEAWIEVDTWELTPAVGDRYLLCSDGLTNELSDDTIREMLNHTTDPKEAAQALVDDACEAGGRDNVSVVVVDVLAPAPDESISDTASDDNPTAANPSTVEPPTNDLTADEPTNQFGVPKLS